MFTKKMFASLVLLLSIFPLFANSYIITQITDDASQSLLDNGNIIWQDNTTNKKLFLYDGAGIIQLANTPPSRFLTLGDLENNKAVWTEGDFTANFILLYIGKTKNIIGDSTGYKFNVKMDNGQIIWNTGNGTGNDVWFYDGDNVTRITEDGSCSYEAFLDNGQVVWTDKTDIFTYDSGNNIGKIHVGAQFLYIHDFDQGQILYSARIDDIYQLYLQDSGRTIAISPDAGAIQFPNLNEGKVAYTTYSGSWLPPGYYRPLPLYNVFLYENGNTIQLTSNGVEPIEPDGFEDERLVWVERVGDTRAVYMYDGFTISRISPDSSLIHSPVINKGMVMWQEYTRIMLAVPEK